MRARNIKPGLFQNEILAEASSRTVLTFLGLTMLADREGRLEYRPLKIHLALHPLRGVVAETVEDIAWLAEHGFLTIYDVERDRFIWIDKFTKHQRPHVREVASIIPAFAPSTTKEQPRHSPGTTKEQPRCSDSGFSDSGSLNPENGFSDVLIPESGSSDSGLPRAAEAERQPAAATRMSDEDIEKAKKVIREPKHQNYNDHDIATLADVPVDAVREARKALKQATRRVN